MMTFSYGIDTMTPGLALDICRGKVKGELSREVVDRVRNNRKVIDDIVAANNTVYGVNTGFGPLCTTLISEADTRKLQLNLLLSHAVGVGDFISEEISRLMLILKVHSLAYGYSGISFQTLNRIIWHIDNKVTRWVHRAIWHRWHIFFCR
jgi:histidine ammonia-lyase